MLLGVVHLESGDVGLKVHRVVLLPFFWVITLIRAAAVVESLNREKTDAVSEGVCV